ncbi:hypothetical protein ABK040_014187 [Willaertia magna]
MKKVIKIGSSFSNRKMFCLYSKKTCYHSSFINNNISTTTVDNNQWHEQVISLQKQLDKSILGKGDDRWKVREKLYELKKQVNLIENQNDKIKKIIDLSIFDIQLSLLTFFNHGVILQKTKNEIFDKIKNNLEKEKYLNEIIKIEAKQRGININNDNWLNLYLENEIENNETFKNYLFNLQKSEELEEFLFTALNNYFYLNIEDEKLIILSFYYIWYKCLFSDFQESQEIDEFMIILEEKYKKFKDFEFFDFETKINLNISSCIILCKAIVAICHKNYSLAFQLTELAIKEDNKNFYAFYLKALLQTHYYHLHFNKNDDIYKTMNLSTSKIKTTINKENNTRFDILNNDEDIILSNENKEHSWLIDEEELANSSSSSYKHQKKKTSNIINDPYALNMRRILRNEQRFNTNKLINSIECIETLKQILFTKGTSVNNRNHTFTFLNYDLIEGINYVALSKIKFEKNEGTKYQAKIAIHHLLNALQCCKKPDDIKCYSYLGVASSLKDKGEPEQAKYASKLESMKYLLNLTKFQSTLKLLYQALYELRQDHLCLPNLERYYAVAVNLLKEDNNLKQFANDLRLYIALSHERMYSPIKGDTIEKHLEWCLNEFKYLQETHHSELAHFKIKEIEEKLNLMKNKP